MSGSRSNPVAADPADPAALLLARYVRVDPGADVVFMNAGYGLTAVPPETLRGAGSVRAADRNIVATMRASETLRNARVLNGGAFAGHGAFAFDTASSMVAAAPVSTSTAVSTSVSTTASSSSAASADIVVIRIPREKLPLLQLLRDAFAMLRVGGRCYIAGATNEGIKSAVRLMSELFGNAEVIARENSHRIAIGAKRSANPVDATSFADPFLDATTFREIEAVVRGEHFTLYTRPGVFSWDHVDEATSILATTMEIRAGESVLDIGCGAGALGVVAARLSSGGRVMMVDADAEAIRCATRTAANAHAPNAEVMASDVGAAVIDQRFDVVVTNPPFHSGRTTDLDLPARFIRDARTVLNAGGRLYLVANRTLPYEREISRVFGNVAIAHAGPRFKVLTAGAVAPHS